MAAAKIIVVEKNEGEKIAYDVSTTKIIFGDDDLMVNIKNRERDEEVTLVFLISPASTYLSVFGKSFN